MKDEILAAIIGVAFILWQFCILFGLWGGLPEGAFVKIGRLETQMAIQSAQIEVLRSQMSQVNLSE